MYRIIIVDETIQENGTPKMELHKNVEVAEEIAMRVIEVIDEEL